MEIRKSTAVAVGFWILLATICLFNTRIQNYKFDRCRGQIVNLDFASYHLLFDTQLEFSAAAEAMFWILPAAIFCLTPKSKNRPLPRSNFELEYCQLPICINTQIKNSNSDAVAVKLRLLNSAKYHFPINKVQIQNSTAAAVKFWIVDSASYHFVLNTTFY